jgi:hypothetical protein
VKAVPWDIDRGGFTLTGSVVESGGLYVFLLKIVYTGGRILWLDSGGLNPERLWWN